MKRLPVTLAAAAALATLAVPSTAHALDWNFSIQYSNGDIASGTFTTDGTAAVPGQVYTISSISGTHAGIAITSLSGVGGASQKFQFNGSTINGDGGGISYSYSTSEFNAYVVGGGFGPLNTWDKFVSGSLSSQGSVASSSISPVSSSSSVPGPIPLLGAGAAFGWSRRLRRRVMSSADPSRLAAIVPPQGWS